MSHGDGLQGLHSPTHTQTHSCTHYILWYPDQGHPGDIQSSHKYSLQGHPCHWQGIAASQKCSAERWREAHQTLEAAHSPPPQCWWDSMCLPQHILWVQGPQGDTGDSFFSFSMCWLNNSEVVADDEEIIWSWEETEGVKGKSIPQPLG